MGEQDVRRALIPEACQPHELHLHPVMKVHGHPKAQTAALSMNTAACGNCRTHSQLGSNILWVNTLSGCISFSTARQ